MADPTPDVPEATWLYLARFPWQVGPMSTSGTATVKWARYNVDGTPTGQRGVAGTSFSGTKATAMVGKDDNFYIVTTAQ